MTFIQNYQGVPVLDGRPVRSAVYPCDCVAGEDELSRFAPPIGALRESEVSGLLDFPHLNDPANLNLVPWMNLPRRAQHRNEQARLFRQ